MHLCLGLIFLFLNLVNSKVPCDPESFQFVESPRIVDKAGEYKFYITNNQELGCAINVTYDWRLYHVYGRSLIPVPLETKALVYPGRSKLMVNEVHVRKIDIDETDNSPKKFALKVTLIPVRTYYPSYRMWYFGIPAPAPSLIAISGGSERTHWMDGNSLWLNITGVPDESVMGKVRDPVWECHPPFKGGSPPNDLKWKILESRLEENVTHECKVTVDLIYGQEETASQIIHIRRYYGVPQIELRCVLNCDPQPASAYEETTLQFYCHGDYCQEDPKWDVRPHDDKYMTKADKNATQITFKANTFPPDSTIDVIATSGDATANYTIIFATQNPTLALSSTKDNENYDSLKDMKFEVSCSSQCDNLMFSWEINPTPMAGLEVPDPIDHILTIPANSFPPETTVSLWARSGIGAAELEFTTAAIVENTLTVTCVNSDCEELDPQVQHELKITCDTCPDDNWHVDNVTIEPIPKNYHWLEHALDRNRTLIVPANTYQDDEEGKFEIHAGYMAAGEQTVKFKLKDVTLTLECVENCDPDDMHPNPYKEVKMSATCSGGFRRQNHRQTNSDGPCNGPYQWWFEPPPLEFNFTAYQLSDHGSFLTIPPNLYKEGEEVKVSVTLGKGKAEKDIEFIELKPEIEVKCIINCITPGPNPLKETVFRVVCNKACDNIYYIWTADPSPDQWFDHFELGENNKTLTVKAGTYKDKDVVTFQANTKADKESHVILDYQIPLPVVSLECIKNCDNPWISEESVYRVECSQNCNNLTYTWTVTPEPIRVKWEKNLKLSDDNSTLTIMPYTYKDGDEVDIQAFVKPLTVPEIKPMKTVTFEELATELKLTCLPTGCNTIVNRLESVSLQVECVKHCNETQYRWSIDPKSALKWGKSIRGIDNTTLTILPESIKQETNITVTVESGSNPKSAASSYFVFRNPQPEFVIVCDENCNFSNPRKPVLLRVQCNYLCKYVYKYEWKLTPAKTKVEVTGPKHYVFKIAENVYKDGAIVTVNAIWDKTNASLTLYFVEPPAEIEIICVRNCKYNPKLNTSFEVHCKEHCYKNMAYKWKITPKSKNQTEEINQANTLVTFPSGMYQAYDKVNLTVTLNKGKANLFVIFMDPTPVLQLECIDCDSHGRSEPTKPTSFQVTCISDCETLIYNWTLDVTPIKFKATNDIIVSNDTSIMTIRENVYLNDTTVRVFVSSGRTNISQDVHFYEASPDLVVFCVENCGFPYVDKELVVRVECIAKCDNLDRYVWTILPAIDNTERLSNDNVTMTIPEDSYGDDDSILISVQNKGTEATIQFTYTFPPPVLKVSCKPSCTQADPDDTLKLSVKCRDNCFEPFFIWGLRPTLPGFVWSLNVTEEAMNKSITVAPNTFVDGSKTNAIVISNKNAYIITEIIFVERIPKIEYSCSKNCDFNPSKPVKFKVKCRKYCNKATIKCDFVPPPYDPSLITLTNETFDIAKDAYENNDNVSVKCNVKKAYVENLFEFRLRIKDGECILFPTKGTSGVTKHTVDCVHIREKHTYRVFQKIPGFEGPGLLLWYGPHPIIQDLIFTPTIDKDITAVVGIGWDSRATFNMRTKEKDFISRRKECNKLKLRILGNGTEDLYQMLKNEEYFKAIQLAAVLDNALQLCPPEYYYHYRKHILEAFLAEINNKKIEPYQMLTFMIKMAVGVTYERDLYIYHLCMEGIRISFQGIINQIYPGYKESALASIAGQTLASIDSILKNAQVKDNRRASYPESFQHETEINIFAMSTKRHCMFITNDVILAVDAIADAYKIWGQDVTIERGAITTMNYYIKPPKKSFNVNIANSGQEVNIEFSPSISKDLKVNPNELIIKVALFTEDLFWWDPTINNHSKSILLIGISSDGTKIDRADIDITFWSRSRTKSGTITDEVNKKTNFIVYEFEVPQQSTLKLLVTPHESAEMINVAISEWQPTLEWAEDNGEQIRASKTKYSYTNYNKIYVGISGRGQFRLEFLSYECLSWHGKTWAWDPGNCQLHGSRMARSKMVVCKCTQLSLFTTRITIPKFSRKDPVPKPLSGNVKYFWYVPAITGTAAVLMIAALLCAHLGDVKARKLYKLHILEDNAVHDNEMYLVAVQTGVWKDSGTTARVAIQIEGVNGESRVHLLNAKDNTLLQRNSSHCFVIYTQKFLGKITTLRVWHDSFGNQPHWYCDTIVIRHVASRKRYVFTVCRWFSLIWGDGQTYRSFQPKKKATPLCFNTKFEESLRMNHHYLGFFTDRATPGASKRNVAVSSTAILVMMAAMFFLMYEDTFWNMFLSILLSAAIGVIAAVLLDILFRKSKRKLPKGYYYQTKEKIK